MENRSDQVRAARWIRRIACLIGSLAGACWLLSLAASFIGEVISNTFTWNIEGLMLGALVIASASGVLIAWRREGIGGAILVICGLALSVFAYFSAGHKKLFAILVSGVPFFVTGVLFLLSWWMLELDGQG